MYTYIISAELTTTGQNNLTSLTSPGPLTRTRLCTKRYTNAALIIYHFICFEFNR